MHIGQRIRNVMKQRKVSTAAMAKHCGVTAGAVSNWFATGRITKENLAKVADRLSVPIEDLISGAVGEREDSPLPDMYDPGPVPDGLLVATSGGGKSKPVLVLIEELELILNTRELLPEDRSQFLADVQARADQMRAHARLVLERAGVSAPASDERVAAYIKPAPTGNEPQHVHSPLRQDMHKLDLPPHVKGKRS